MTLTSSRPVRWALLLSLAINVALIAVLAWQHAPWRERGGYGRHAAIPHLLDVRALRGALTPERESILRPVLEAHRENIRGRLGDLFRARRALRETIAAEPFDAAALEAAFAQLRAADAATASEAHAMLVEVLAAATPEERKKMAELMAKRGPRGGRREHQARDGDTDAAQSTQ
jgi:uncharacterized membrane protein